MINAAEVQIRQGASMQQLDEFLQELSECYEVDKSLSEVRNSWFQWHVKNWFHFANGVPANLPCCQLCGMVSSILSSTPPLFCAMHLVSKT